MVPYYEATPEDIERLKEKKARGELISVNSPRGRELLKQFCEHFGIETKDQINDANEKRLNFCSNNRAAQVYGEIADGR